MIIQYNNQLTEEQYRDRRYNVLLWLETVGGRVDLTPYTDNPNGGYATIGAGFKIDSNWNAILGALGFNTTKDASEAEKAYISQIQALVGKDRKFTSSQMTTLITDINNIMKKRAEDSNVTNAIYGQDKRTEFKFNDEPEVQATFQVIADDREKTLCKWLGEDPITSKYSIVPRGNERIALLSLVYNNVVGFNKDGSTKSPKLLNALQQGNRAEAWFEIRYNSNLKGTGFEDGIAKRRYYESQLFGLYNNTQSVDAEEAKQTYRMLQLHRQDIYAYEVKFGTAPNSSNPDTASSQVGKANTDYNLTDAAAKVQTLTQILTPAKNAMMTYLQSLHPQLGQLSVDRSIDIYLDPGRDKSEETFNPNHSATLDARNGDSRSSRDILIGEGGDDKFWGGKGNDILLGGTGNDTYYYRIGDGNDTIIDEDNRGKIVIQKQGTQGLETIAVGNLYKVGDANIWKDANGKITITHNSPYQIILEDGSTITLGDNFQDGDFGIHLLDTPADPVTTNTITGNEYANDGISDTTANDRIELGGGDDTIGAHNGGNDWVLGGSGRDAISTGYGNDIVEGGADSDIIFGSGGDDKVFGETSGNMETLIANGETATSINEKGDLVSGNDGNDLVYGTNRKDALFGGEGHDLLVGRKTNIMLKLAA